MIQTKKILKKYIYHLTGNRKYAYAPYTSLLLSQRYRFAYCPIPKVANSSIKVWMLRLHGCDDFDLDNDLHLKAQAIFGLRDNGMPPRTINGYFKFAFVRDPVERLVSAYLNKFVVHFNQDRLPSVDKVLAHYGRSEDEGISFREFLNHLEGADLSKVDLHWRPQYLILGNLKYDFIGKIENFDADFEYISTRLGVPPPTVAINATKVAREYEEDDYSSLRSGELRQLKYPPPFAEFLDAELTRRIRELYRPDYNLFGY